LAILTTVTLASTNNALTDDGVTAPKHVGAVLTLILLMWRIGCHQMADGI